MELKELSNNNRLIIRILLAVVAIGLSFAMLQIDNFGDGLYHVVESENILDASGDYTYVSAVGHRNFNIDPMGAEPMKIQPPFYYVVINYLSTMTSVDTETVIEIIGVLCVVLTLFTVLRIGEYINSDKRYILLSGLLLLISPMVYWLVSHRLIENFLVLVLLQIVWILFEKKSDYNLFILGVLFLVLSQVKLNGLILAIPMVLYVIYYSRLKSILLILFITVLSLPFIYFSFVNIGTVYPSSFRIPIIDTKILVPYRFDSSNRADWEDELGEVVNQSGIIDEMNFDDSQRLPFIRDELKRFNILGVAQFFSILPLNHSLPNAHWYGTQSYIRILASLVLGVIAVISIIKNREKLFTPESTYKYLIIGLWCVAFLLYFKTIAIQRYLFPVAILSVFIYSTSLLSKDIKHRFIVYPLIVFITLSNIGFILTDSIRYRNTFLHVPNPTPAVSLQSEFDDLNDYLSTRMGDSQCLFTNYHGLRYYTPYSMKWDSRLLYVNQDALAEYFPNYDCNYLLLSNNVEGELIEELKGRLLPERIYHYYTLYTIRSSDNL